MTGGVTAGKALTPLELDIKDKQNQKIEMYISILTLIEISNCNKYL